MRRNISLLIAGATALLAATACSDVGTAPRSVARQAASVASFDASRSGHAGSVAITRFTIHKKGGVVPIMMPGSDEPLFTLSFPANAVCDPTDGYGDFDAPCSPVGHSVHVTATVHYVHGSPGVDFSPELRFDPSKVVTISTTRDRDAVFAMASSPTPNWNAFAILYTPDSFQSLVADAQVDPDMVTHISASTGLVWRRIKHFSGYWVGTGYVSCDSVTSNPSCTEQAITSLQP